MVDTAQLSKWAINALAPKDSTAKTANSAVTTVIPTHATLENVSHSMPADTSANVHMVPKVAIVKST